jgi:hypothetical protein
MDRSPAANDLKPSASFSVLNNPQRIPVNPPQVFQGLWPCSWLLLVKPHNTKEIIQNEPRPYC